MSFEITNVQMDYSTNTISVYFKGYFNELEARNSIQKSYPSFKINKIIDFCSPYEFKGYVNEGVATFN